MRYFLILSLFCLLFLGFNQVPAEAEPEMVPPFQWKLGEELVFKVRWSLVRLGTLHMHVEDTVRIKGRLLYRVHLRLDSNPVLIFVNLHNEYECLIDSLYRPVVYWVDERGMKDRKLMVYQFDYDSNKVYWQILDPDDSTRVIKEQILDLEHYMYDGISLTFFARGNAQENRDFKLYSFFYDRIGPVDMRFRAEKKLIKVPAIDRAFKTVRVEGVIHLKGIAGVTGEYKGWFTRDQRRVPIKALLKVFVGNVVVELEKWKGWNP